MMTKKELTRKELIKELDRKHQEILDLTKEIHQFEERLRAFISAEDGTPSDCKRGIWCKSCVHVKTLHIPRRSVHRMVMGGYETVYFCGKGESCANFAAPVITDE